MWKKLRSYRLIIAGNAMIAMAVSIFFAPNKIIIGGASGIAIIIHYTLDLKLSLANALINAVLLFMAFLCFGWKFILKTVFSIVSLTIFMEVFSYILPVTDNMMLATIFGAVLYGIGTGIVLSQRCTSGGTEILGRMIQHRFPQWKIGKILLGVDLFVIFLSFVTFRTTEAILYGIIALFISTTSVDSFFKHLNISKLVFVISSKGEEIAHLLIETSSRGVTLADVTGVYSNQSMQMLICALKEGEFLEFRRKILEKDESAFIICSEAQQVVGNGFYIYG